MESEEISEQGRVGSSLPSCRTRLAPFQFMHFIKQPAKKKRRDAKRGNGGRIKALLYQVGYKKHTRAEGYCVWVKGLTGWSPTGNGYPITEEEAIKQGKQIAKETKSEWIGEWSGLL